MEMMAVMVMVDGGSIHFLCDLRERMNDEHLNNVGKSSRALVHDIRHSKFEYTMCVFMRYENSSFGREWISNEYIYFLVAS